MSSLPTDTGVEDLIMDAIKDLLTSACQTSIDTGDVSRVEMIKVGPRQDAPESVSIMIYENDPDRPSDWPHRPISFRHVGARSGTLVGDPYNEGPSFGMTTGRHLTGGGSMYAAAFTLEMEAFGLYFPSIGRAVNRYDVSHVAAVTVNRALKALFEAGPQIGTGDQISDVFGKSVIDGPFMGDRWADPNTGEALLVRKFVRIWYKVFNSWSTNAWTS